MNIVKQAAIAAIMKYTINIIIVIVFFDRHRIRIFFNSFNVIIVNRKSSAHLLSYTRSCRTSQEGS